jgi:hypothetical protein
VLRHVIGNDKMTNMYGIKRSEIQTYFHISER